jgi:hypothetical protein
MRQLFEEEARRRVTDATGAYRPDLWLRGIDLVAHMPVDITPFALGFGGGGPASGALVGALWTQIGPAPLRAPSGAGTVPWAGRVYDHAIDPSGTTDQTIYVATLGGVWKTRDGGASWAPKTDRLPWTQLSAIALDPNNASTIYAGAFYSPGPGLFKSIDGGETWTAIGGATFQNQLVTRIVVTASGAVLVGTISSGLFRSVDGGASFGNNSPGYNNGAAILGGRLWDLKRDTATGSTVYACVGGVGLFVSTDNGATFPTNLFTATGAPAMGTYDCLTMAQSTLPNNRTFYVSVATAAATPGYLGLYKSTTAGASWSTVAAAAAAAAASAQFGFNQTVGVDPQDPKYVYIGFEDLWLSTGGAFNDVSGGRVHSDHHALGFSPQSHWAGKPTRIYVGCDGGFATSADTGTTWTNLNEGVATILVNDLDIGRESPANEAYSYCVSQDNGTAVRRPGMPGTDWALSNGGDAWGVAVDPSNPQNAYADVNRFFQRTSNAGVGSWQNASGLPGSVDGRAVDFNDGTVVYVWAGTDLYQSKTSGASFNLMHTFPASIKCVGVVPSDSNALWVAAGGLVWKTGNALAGAASAWNSFSTGLATWGISSIAVDPVDPNRAVAGVTGVTGIPAPNRSGHVYLTQDGGGSWVDASGTDGGPVATNLPDRSVWSVAIDPGTNWMRGLFALGASGTRIFAGGQQGVVVSSEDGATWVGELTGVTNTIAELTWTGTQFVAVGLGGLILTSPDGIAWTTRRSTPSWEALQGVAWSGSILVATSASFPQVYTSPDGITWTPRGGVAPQALLDIVWGGGQFVAVGYGGTIITSPDGITWTTRTSPVAQNLVAVVWSGSQYVVGGLNGAILTSPDGITWTQRVSPTSNEINAIAWSGTGFVGVINTGEVIRSSDGISWSIQASSTTNRLLDIAWFKGRFVAVGDFDIITSSDGVTWTDQSFSDSAPFALIAASDTTVFSSVDAGATWKVLGVGLPASPCMKLALDWTRTPSLLRVGTNGRSVFELAPTSGPQVAVLSNLAFGPVAVGSSATLAARVCNVGSAPLAISSFVRSSGSAQFAFTGPALPITLAPGTEADFTLTFQPTAAGNATASFQLSSNDPANPTVAVPVSGAGS